MAAIVPVWSEHQFELSEIFPKQNEDVHSTILDREIVLLNLSTGRYYTLNAVGSLVWQHCTGTRSLAQIMTSICDNFDVTVQQAQDDLTDLVVQLAREGLLHTERR